MILSRVIIDLNILVSAFYGKACGWFICLYVCFCNLQAIIERMGELEKLEWSYSKRGQVRFFCVPLSAKIVVNYGCTDLSLRSVWYAQLFSYFYSSLFVQTEIADSCMIVCIITMVEKSSFSILPCIAPWQFTQIQWIFFCSTLKLSVGVLWRLLKYFSFFIFPMGVFLCSI